MKASMKDLRTGKKRQAAPFFEPPKEKPKRRGRKPGYEYGGCSWRQPKPREVDEGYRAGPDAASPEEPLLRSSTRTERDMGGRGRMRRVNKANERLRKHLSEYGWAVARFLLPPQTDPTHWLADQMIRSAVVNRKVRVGNRTPAEARAQVVVT